MHACSGLQTSAFPHYLLPSRMLLTAWVLLLVLSQIRSKAYGLLKKFPAASCTRPLPLDGMHSSAGSSRSRVMFPPGGGGMGGMPPPPPGMQPVGWAGGLPGACRARPDMPLLGCWQVQQYWFAAEHSCPIVNVWHGVLRQVAGVPGPTLRCLLLVWLQWRDGGPPPPGMLAAPGSSPFPGGRDSGPPPPGHFRDSPYQRDMHPHDGYGRPR